MRIALSVALLLLTASQNVKTFESHEADDDSEETLKKLESYTTPTTLVFNYDLQVGYLN